MKPTRTMRRTAVGDHPIHGWILGLVVLAIMPGLLEAQGQPLSATGRRDLSFGNLIPGVTTVVSRRDAARAGQFEIRGARRAEVSIVFQLPAALMRGPSAIPLQFGPNDGGFSRRPRIRNARAFDPRVTLVTRLSNRGRLYLFLGGTALPGTQLRAGRYQASITLTIAYTGA